MFYKLLWYTIPQRGWHDLYKKLKEDGNGWTVPSDLSLSISKPLDSPERTLQQGLEASIWKPWQTTHWIWLIDACDQVWQTKRMVATVYNGHKARCKATDEIRCWWLLVMVCTLNRPYFKFVKCYCWFFIVLFLCYWGCHRLELREKSLFAITLSSQVCLG